MNQSISTRHLAKSRHGQAICQLFEMKRLFLFIGNLAGCIEENVSTREKRRPRRGDFHARNHFAPSTIPEEKWRTILVVYIHAYTQTLFIHAFGVVAKITN